MTLIALCSRLLEDRLNPFSLSQEEPRSAISVEQAEQCKHPLGALWASTDTKIMKPLISLMLIKRRCRARRGTEHLPSICGRRSAYLNKAGLTSGGCLPCQNDNKFLITERS